MLVVNIPTPHSYPINHFGITISISTFLLIARSILSLGTLFFSTFTQSIQFYKVVLIIPLLRFLKKRHTPKFFLPCSAPFQLVILQIFVPSKTSKSLIEYNFCTSLINNYKILQALKQVQNWYFLFFRSKTLFLSSVPNYSTPSVKVRNCLVDLVHNSL